LDCIGYATDFGLEFSEIKYDENNRDVTGTIKWEENVAVVTITSPDWIDDITQYKYYKTSDIPNMYVPE
jgi:hypothetical protein